MYFCNEVAVLADDQLQAGNHNAKFDAGHLPPGVYFYFIHTNEGMKSGKMILIK